MATDALWQRESLHTGHDSPWNEKEHPRILNLKLLLKNSPCLQKRATCSPGRLHKNLAQPHCTFCRFHPHSSGRSHLDGVALIKAEALRGWLPSLLPATSHDPKPVTGSGCWVVSIHPPQQYAKCSQVGHAKMTGLQCKVTTQMKSSSN